MYKLLPKTHTDSSEFPASESKSSTPIPLEFLCEAVFAGGPSLYLSLSLSLLSHDFACFCIIINAWSLQMVFGVLKLHLGG